MREDGLQQAIQAAGGIGALARALGISQPAVSTWRKIPAERVLSVEALTGVARSMLRPDLYPMDEIAPAGDSAADEIDLLRAHEYDLLAVLLGRAPTREVLDRLERAEGRCEPARSRPYGARRGRREGRSRRRAARVLRSLHRCRTGRAPAVCVLLPDRLSPRAAARERARGACRRSASSGPTASSSRKITSPSCAR